MPDRSDRKTDLTRRSTTPSEVTGHLGDLVPRADLTYRTFEGLTLTDRSLERSLLTGALFRSCIFSNVELRRCDLDGTRIEGCQFTGCSFENVDLRSSTIVRSTFKNCNFDEALISDCTFFESALEQTSLSATISECSFTASHLVDCSLEGASFLQSRFDHSVIQRMTLGDCTFLYNIMKECTFSEVRINAESLGMVYGLTPENVAEMGLVYLGQDQRILVSENLAALVETYETRRWYFGVAVMRMNFRLTSTVYAIAEYLKTLKAGGALKRDEVGFFARVLEDLAGDHRLPLMSCITAIEIVNDLLGRTPSGEPDQQKQAELLRSLSGRLMMTLAKLLDLFEERRLPVDDFGTDREIQLDLRFRSRPALAASALLKQIARVSGLPVDGSSRTLDTRTGSYIEIVRTTLLSAVALQTFLYLLNGSIVQITELRARLKVLAKRRLPAPYRTSALQPAQNLPPSLVGPVRKLLAHSTGLDWLEDPNLRGYDASNLIEGSISDAPKSSERPANRKAPKTRRKTR